MPSSSRLHRVLLLSLCAAAAFAQTAPQINTLTSTPSPVYGGQAFTLNINGARLCDQSMVRFNNNIVPSTFVNSTLITAAISGTATLGLDGQQVPVQIVNLDSPVPGCSGIGQSSNIVNWSITPTPITVSPATLPNASTSALYGAQISATGGVPGYTFNIQPGGSLPSGLTMSSGGLISGFAGSTGTFNFVVAATDSIGGTGTRPYAIVVTSPLSMNSASLADGKVGVNYSQAVTASGGTAPYTYSLGPESSLPPGLTLSPAGVISGMPTESGFYSFGIVVVDGTSQSASGFFFIYVDGGVLFLTTSPLPAGTTGVPYSLQLQATTVSAPVGLATVESLAGDGTRAAAPTAAASPPVVKGATVMYTYSVVNGSSLPPGLTLTPSGLLSGIPTIPGSYTFQLRVQNSFGDSSVRTFSLAIAPGPLSITTPSLGSGETGVPYSQSVVASGGAPPFTFSISAGSLPAGLSISSGGVIQGTPTAGGNFAFTVRVVDRLGTAATRNYTIFVRQRLSILTNAFSQGVEGAPFAEAVIAEGGTSPYRFSLVNDPPPGMTILPNGFFSGTPSRAGSYTVRVRVDDSAEGVATKDIPFTVVAGVRITTTALPNATVGNDYAQALAATGGQAPYIWSTSSQLPAGLTLTPAGVLTGRPQQAGTRTILVRVRDERGSEDSRDFSITVVPASATPQISTTSLPPGTVGIAYNQTLSGTGGQTPYTWSLIGGVPPGVSINPTTGALTGTPTQAGSFNLQVQLRDAANTVANATIPVTINPGTGPVITTTTLPAATQNAAYSQQLAASGGQTPYTWSLVEGSAPGITLNAQGLLSGTPTQTGSFSLQVRVRDAQQRQDTRVLTLQVQNVLTIQTTTLPGATLNSAYSTQITAAGGAPPYTWSVLSGAPAGLSINNQGVLSGTPSQSGTFSVQVQVRDSAGATATRTFSLAVQSVLQITTTTLPGASQNNPYQATLAAAGGTTPYVWSTSSILPFGISLSPEGVLSGTPLESGSFPLSITVRDAREATTSATLTLTVGTNLQITTSAVPSAIPGNTYTAGFAATGGVQPYQWSAPNGLPTGLQLDPSTGILSGVAPLQAGNYNFVIQVRDAANQTASRSFTLVVGSPLTIINTSLRQGVTGTLYQETLVAAGGIGPYTWTAFGSLPPGLILNPTTGFITGTPSTPGGFNVTIRVTDAAGQFADTALTLQIISNLQITSTLPDGLVGTPYSQLLAATGGTPPYTWALNGSLPGLQLDPFTGTLAGTPSQAGSFPISISVTDALGATTSRNYTVTIAVPLTISPATLPGAAVGITYSQAFSATGGTAPFVFQLASGSVPGLILNGIAGALQGTPTQAGSYPITIRVTDSLGRQANRDYTLVVTANLRILTSSLAPAVQRTAYNASLEATGGTPPYRWRVTSSNLPAGLTLAESGQFSGTPTEAGTFPLAIEVRDANNITATANLSLIVQPGLTIQPSGALPGGNVGTPYALQLNASGGTVPLSWRLSGGSLPAGLTIDNNGRIAGTPTSVGETSGTVEVTDANGVTATAPISIAISAALLRITSASQIPSVTTGASVQFSAAAIGGTPPYTWSLSGAPAGLSINASSGVISGSLATAGTFPFQLRVTDAAGTSAEQQISVQVTLPPVPPLNITGVPATVQAGQQVIPGLTLSQPFPVAISGELVLTFAPDGNVDDPAIQFANGGRTVPFNIAAGSTQPSLTPSQVGIQVGTVAGTITITASMTAGGTNVTPDPAPRQIIRIPPAAPVITSLRVNRTATGFELLIVGFATSREVTGATVRLQTTGTVQGTEFTINLTQPMQAWYQSTASFQHGSAFALTLPFTIQSGTGGGAISSVSVTLTNAIGTSAAATANF